MIARLTLCRGFVEIEGRLWRDRFPVCALPAWRRFYQQMAARKDGRHARHYAATIAALDTVARDLDAGGAP